MPTKKTIEVTDIAGKTHKVTTADIEKVSPFCPYVYPHPKCSHVGSKVVLKNGWFITADTMEEIAAKVKAVSGRVRGKNKEESHS